MGPKEFIINIKVNPYFSSFSEVELMAIGSFLFFLLKDSDLHIIADKTITPIIRNNNFF